MDSFFHHFATQGIRNDIEKRVMRAENKSNSLHDAELHSIRVQHSSEVECLREELAAERQRNLNTINKEKELLAISQAKEAELRFELQTMKDGPIGMLDHLKPLTWGWKWLKICCCPLLQKALHS